MEEFHEYVDEYKQQLKKGHIQKAYKGIMEYIMGLKSYLKNKYSTIMAEDGPEALEELDKEKFDVIITDLEMPKMQGFDLIKEIREQKELKEIEIRILYLIIGFGLGFFSFVIWAILN